MVQYTRPYLYPKQLDAIFCEERFATIEASTKAGKTLGTMAWLLEQALIKGKPGQNFWWISPGYSQSSIPFKRFKTFLTKGSFKSSESPIPTLELINGAVISFRSGDNAEMLYGEDVYAAVIDEASRVKEDCWYALRSTITATNGPVRMIGNVHGRKNWFYNLCRIAERGDDPEIHYARITAQDAVDSGVLKAKEIEDARRVLPENVFRELYFAEPGDDLGNPFGLEHIRACVNGSGLGSSPAIAYGMDLAKKQDYFVIVGLNEKGEVCEFDRWNKVSWRISVARARIRCGENIPVLVDSTGIGDPVYEELSYERGNYFKFVFTQSSKQKLMEGLAVAIQSKQISYPDGVIKEELENFEYVIQPNGTVKYSAMQAPGIHDDCVVALGLARQQFVTNNPGNTFLKYYSGMREEVRKDKVQEEIYVNPDKLGKVTKENLNSELDKLYKSTLALFDPNSGRICERCKVEIAGPSKVSDGVNSWHMGCV